ncbi:hypothetical protein HPB47_000078 [Ixodes persulcatus]|uniref:Uncharacterized protein n=1 Tax=Ixodes persulcatus TaxID=34615 RepID=A0AC60PSR4_IXOPE|nr:hypothetical protein HPB47_000078 [Ixodes persulcatus]
MIALTTAVTSVLLIFVSQASAGDDSELANLIRALCSDVEKALKDALKELNLGFLSTTIRKLIKCRDFKVTGLICKDDIIVNLPSALNAGNNASAQPDPEKGKDCDEERFSNERERCDFGIKLQLLVSHGDALVACAALDSYKMCLAQLVRQTMCGQREFLVKQLEPMRLYLRQNNVRCARQKNVSLASQNSVQKPMIQHGCSGRDIFETQLRCGVKFQTNLRDIAGRGHSLSKPSQVCRTVSSYYDCLNALLGTVPCQQSPLLMKHADYFPTVLTRKYRAACEEELSLTAMRIIDGMQVKVARTLGSSELQSHGECRSENATKTFMGCGLQFNEIVSHNPGREKVCQAYTKLGHCCQTLLHETNCATSMPFHKSVMHVLHVLLSPYDQYCRNFVSDVSLGPPPDWSWPTPGPETTAPPVCDYDVYIERHIECGLTYIFDIRGTQVGNTTSTDSVVCDLLSYYFNCINSVKEQSHCTDDPPISQSLQYFVDTLKNSSGQSCETLRKKNKMKFRSSQSSCSIREYTGSYFNCGATFLQNTYHQQPSEDEKCRFYFEFRTCEERLIACKTPTDVSASLSYFSIVMTEGYADMCRDYNKSTSCDRLTLLKNFYDCTERYYQAFHEFLLENPDVRLQQCRLIEDMENCTKVQVFDNDCKGLQTLFLHMKTFQEYIRKLFNQRQASPCPRENARNWMTFRDVRKQTMCDQYKAVKKLVLCGVGFHRMLSAAQNNATATNNTSICPLVKEMKYCTSSATHDSGCSDADLLAAEVSALQRNLLLEHEGACGSASSPVDEDYLRHRQGTCTTNFLAVLALRVVPDENLRAHSVCLNESADRHDCSTLAPQVADLSNQLLSRFKAQYCSGPSRQMHSCPGVCTMLGPHWMPLILIAMLSWAL